MPHNYFLTTSAATILFLTICATAPLSLLIIGGVHLIILPARWRRNATDYIGGNIVLYELRCKLRPGDVLLFSDSLIHHSNEKAEGYRKSIVAFMQDNMNDCWVRKYRIYSSQKGIRAAGRQWRVCLLESLYSMRKMSVTNPHFSAEWLFCLACRTLSGYYQFI